MEGFECDFCGKETDGCYVDSGRCYCNPVHATKGFEKRMADFEQQQKDDIEIMNYEAQQRGD